MNDLDDAFSALREQHTGTHPDTDASLSQILQRTRTQRSRKLVWQWVLPIAAVFAASTAWASATGRLEVVVHHVFGGEPTRRAPPVRVAAARSVTRAEPERAAEPPVVTALPSSAAPPVASALTRHDAGAEDPHAELFAAAHRVHFVEHDATRALQAWDAYLAAAPRGRFAPEARYNRALSLVRLERRAEAIRELQAFANGHFRGYRQREAQALLDALRDE